jgi:hypothetical protein
MTPQQLAERGVDSEEIHVCSDSVNSDTDDATTGVVSDTEIVEHITQKTAIPPVTANLQHNHCNKDFVKTFFINRHNITRSLFH